MLKTRVLVVAVITGLIVAVLWLQPGQYLGGACESGVFSLDCFKAQRGTVEAFYQSNPLGMMGAFFVIYVLVKALSIPGAAVMTIAAGAIFGLLVGTLLVSFASSIGATLAFLAARFVLRDAIQRRFRRRLKAINEGVEKDGAFYLFAMRLVPAFPFFVINLVMGLTSIRTLTFYVVSQVGMLAGTIVYVNAGTQIAQIESLDGILSPDLIASFALLGVFPLIAKKTLELLRRRKALRGYDKPKHFDYNVIVIGAGSAGLVVSLIAATVRARVALVEKGRMGGDCLNTGCVPSKSLLRSAKLLSHMRRSREFGIRSARFEFEFADVMERVQQVIAKIEPKDSRERYESLGVECFEGAATVSDPWTVEVKGRRLTSRAIVLATGDPEISRLVRERFIAEGVDVRTGYRAKAVIVRDGLKLLVCEHDGADVEIEFDRILIALGRAARLNGFGLEKLGLETDKAIVVNEFLQTSIPTIYACGDAVAPYQFTHSAAHEAWFAAVNGLFGGFKKFKVDYSLIPWCTFVDPEVARVGLSETEAIEEGIEHEVTTFDMGELDRALAESEGHGLVKVVTEKGKDKILGVSVVGDHAGEIIAEFVLAMKHGLGLNKILGTIHIYPTLAEANKFAAGEWKKAHAPEWARDLSRRIHAWRRG